MNFARAITDFSAQEYLELSFCTKLEKNRTQLGDKIQ